MITTFNVKSLIVDGINQLGTYAKLIEGLMKYLRQQYFFG